MSKPAVVATILCCVGACAEGVDAGRSLASDGAQLGTLEDEPEADRLDVGVPPLPGPSCLADAPAAPCFRASLLLAVGPDPQLASIADVTGDGIDDLVLGHAAVATITVLQGPSWGGFDRERVLPTTAKLASLTAADLDGDGIREIVALERGRDALTVFWGGALDEPPWHVELPPGAVALEHRQRHEMPDELLIGFEDATLRTLDLAREPSIGSVVELPEPPEQLAGAWALSSPLVTAAGEAGTISLVEAGEVRVVALSGLTAALGDLTGNGSLDAVVLAGDGPPHVVVGAAADAAWANPSTLPGSAAAVAATLVDLDLDGRAEIVWADDEGRLHIFGWGETGGVERLVLQLETVPSSLHAGDLDGDGWPDLAIVHAHQRSVEIVLRRR